MVIADSGTTDHFLQIQSEEQTNQGLQVKLPHGSVIISTYTTFLNIPQLLMKARRAHISPAITHTLISISMLCTQGYMAIFDHKRVYIIKDSTVILHGNRDAKTNIYMMDSTSDTNTIQP